MTNYADTNKVAVFLGCSTRRVRALLLQGRITAIKNGNQWLITWPLQLTLGKRAPLRKFTSSRNSKTKLLSNTESEV